MDPANVPLPFQETVEAHGHLIDSHIMERIFDTVVEFQGRFEVEIFQIGRTNSDPSHLRLKIETPDRERMDSLLGQLLGLGCTPAEDGDAETRIVEKDACAPEDFYSTTNHRTEVRIHNNWVPVGRQRMDAMVVLGAEIGRAHV